MPDPDFKAFMASLNTFKKKEEEVPAPEEPAAWDAAPEAPAEPVAGVASVVEESPWRAEPSQPDPMPSAFPTVDEAGLAPASEPPSQAPPEPTPAVREAPVAPPSPPPVEAHDEIWRTVEPPVSLHDLFVQMLEWGASDLHLSTGMPPAVRIHGDIYATEHPPLTHPHMMALLYPTMRDADREEFAAINDLDYSIEAPGLARFRVNCLMQNRGMAAVLRVIPQKVPRLEELSLPQVIGQIARYRKGLVLVTGPTGSGKSTTLAAVINEINETRDAHIITIEDPLEFVHESKRCLVTHREIGRDANTFADAIRAAIREDPDIILVGEMRDLDTVAQAIKAAEMGLLVLGTLHTNSAAKAIDRIIDIFPVNQQEQIRVMLSESLRAVIAQQLMKRADNKGRVAVNEILISTAGLGNMIREGKTHQIASVIQTGRDVGMQSMDHALIDLVQRGMLTPQAAKERATDLRAFQRAGIVFDEAPA